MSVNTTTDITWADMDAAGIDIRRVTTQDNGVDGGRDFVAVSVEGTSRVVFGKEVEMDATDDGEADLGWGATSYTREADGYDEWWADGVTDHFDTAAEVLAFVAKHVA